MSSLANMLAAEDHKRLRALTTLAEVSRSRKVIVFRGGPVRIAYLLLVGPHQRDAGRAEPGKCRLGKAGPLGNHPTTCPDGY